MANTSSPAPPSFAELRRAAAKLYASLHLRVRALPALAEHAVAGACDAARRMWWSSAPSLREWRTRLLASLFGVLLAVLAAELVLRLPSLPLPPRLGAALLDCYADDEPYESIFYVEPRLGVHLLQPSYSTTCSRSGHRWRHDGDRWGFRNPETWSKVDVALLGDSFTYGHGVEQHQTMAHFLRGELDLRVANLGVTGACPVQYLAFLRNFALPLAPRVVVVVAFANDVADVSAVRSESELRDYVERGTASELQIYDRQFLIAAAPNPKPWGVQHWQSSSLTYRAARYAYRNVDTRWRQYWNPEQRALRPRHAQRIADANARTPPAIGPLVALQYVRKVFGVMAASARDKGATLVIAALPAQYDRGVPRYRQVPDFLRDIALEHDIPFLDLRPVLTTREGFPIPDTRLSRDGHLTESGNRLVARAIASFLRNNELL